MASHTGRQQSRPCLLNSWSNWTIQLNDPTEPGITTDSIVLSYFQLAVTVALCDGVVGAQQVGGKAHRIDGCPTGVLRFLLLHRCSRNLASRAYFAGSFDPRNAADASGSLPWDRLVALGT